MKFSITFFAAILASTAAAVPAQSVDFETLPQCFPIMDKAQTIRTKDCLDAITELNKRAKKPHPCNRSLQTEWEYITVRSCRVRTHVGFGEGPRAPHCIEPAVVSRALSSLVAKCRNRWGYVDTARVKLTGRNKGYYVSLEEVPSDAPVRTPWDKQ